MNKKRKRKLKRNSKTLQHVGGGRQDPFERAKEAISRAVRKYYNDLGEIPPSDFISPTVYPADAPVSAILYDLSFEPAGSTTIIGLERGFPADNEQELRRATQNIDNKHVIVVKNLPAVDWEEAFRLAHNKAN